jgi:hypothetical protein
LAAKRKQEDEEKRTRAKRMEARLQKEEVARLKREHARELRRKEREAREQSARAVTSTSVNFLFLPQQCPAHDFPVQKDNLKMPHRQLVIALPTILVTTRSRVNLAYPGVALARLWVIGNFVAKFVIVMVSILYVSAIHLSTLAHISIPRMMVLL